MGLYNLDKEYEQEIAQLFEKLSMFEFDDVSSIAICMVVNDGDVVVAHNSDRVRDLVLIGSYVQMLATSRFMDIKEEHLYDNTNIEDMQNDIGLTD